MSTWVAPWPREAYAPVQVPPGTRVFRLRNGRPGTLLGVVQKYRPNLLGTFPVAWADGIWETCAADDVVIASEPAVGSGAA